MHELPEGWRLAPLGELAEINPREEALPDRTQVSFVPMAAVSEVTAAIIAPQARYVADVRKGNPPFRDGDVLFAKITPCMENGKVALVSGLLNGVGFGSTEFHVIRPTARVSPRWIWYFLRRQAVRDEAARFMTGSGGQRRVPAGFLRALPIPLPTGLAAQRALMDILDEADAARLRCMSADEALGDLLPALFSDLFGASDEVGERWPVVPLSMHADVLGGLHLSPTRSGPGSVPYLRVANVYRDRLDLGEVRRMVVTESDLASRALLRGDVLIVGGHGNIEELGRAAVWNGAISPCVHQNLLIRARARTGALRPEYLAHLINAPWGRTYFQRQGETTSGLNNISVKRVRELALPLPPEDLQRRFAEIVHQAAAQRNLVEARTSAVRDLFAELLEGAFIGELRTGSLTRLVGGQKVSLALASAEEEERQHANAQEHRPIWHKLSPTQRRIWRQTCDFSRPFSVADISRALSEDDWNPPNPQHLWGALDLLVTLGVIIKQDSPGIDLWRRPHTENDLEVEV